jgi:DNA-binding NtrC family response regulator
LKLCLIEDDEILGESLCERFRIEGLRFDWFKEGKAAISAMDRRRYELVVCDLRLPDVSGVTVFESIDRRSRPPFIFMTGFGTIDEAVGLLKAGAADFVTKPFDLDALVERVRQLIARPQTQDEPRFGISPAMRKIEALLPRLAATMEPVLVTGESGAGKEIVALHIHERAAGYRTGEWVAVNCAAIPEALLEAELFGYVRGAFTGAARAHKGLIEQANGGTLFLDEIGDMPLSAQARLLRVLQDHKITRIGAEAATPVDFRLICATHRDVPAMVRAGSFREDLYYRINVITIHIPPLRERREDILWLAERMLQQLNRAPRSPQVRLALQAQQVLFAHDWPGNVRELDHALRRAVALGAGPVLDAADVLPNAEPSSTEPLGDQRSLSEHLELTERSFLVATLRECGGGIGEAASRMGISRKTLWEKMRRHGIDRQQFTADGERR